MSKKQRIANRKCSALLAAGAGAAICLTGGGQAHAVNGNISSSNGGTTKLSNLVTFNLFGSKAAAIFTLGVAASHLFSVSASLSFLRSGANVAKLSPGVTIFATGSWATTGEISLVSDKYYGMRFTDAGTKYGWVHVVSFVAASSLRLDTWSYNASGGSIITLSDSVTTSRLALTGGKEKLHWANENEDGVARYEVQSQDASGAWQAMDSDVPGSGSYSAKVDSGKTCRLVVEMTDGSTKEIDF